MADSYSVKARLSAVDSGFSSTLKSAMGTVDGFKSKLSGISFGMLSGVGQSLFNGLKSGVSELIGEIDSSNAAWKNFEGNMKILGKKKKSIDKVKKSLQSYAETTVYSASDMAQTYAQLAAVGTKNTTKLVKGFGGLAAASENPQQAMKTLSQQATQMAAKPKVAWQDFKLMMEQTPAGIAAVAKEMGMTTSQLVKKIQDTKGAGVSTQKFFDAIAKVGNSKGFKKLATEYKTVGQAMDGLKETVSNKLTPAFDTLSKIGIKAVSGVADMLDGIDGNAIAKAVSGWVEKAKPMWESFKNAASKVWAVISGVAKKLAPAFNAVKNSMGGAVKSILDKIGQIDADALVDKISKGIDKMKPYWEAVKSVITSVAGAIKKVMPYIKKVGAAIGSFFLDNSERLSKLIPYVAGAIGAFKGFNLVKSIFGKVSSGIGGAASTIGGGISKILNSVGAMVKNIGSGISTAFTGIGKGISTAFVGIGNGIKAVLSGLTPAIKAIGTAAKGIGKGLESAFTGIGKALKLANPVNILAVGAAIGIVIAAFTLLATQGDGVAKILGGVGSVIESIGTAIGTVVESWGTALGTILGAAIDAIANAMLKLAPVLPIIAQSMVMLTPLVQAFGVAFSLAAVAVGAAMSKVVLAIGESLALIIEALTPVVQIISDLVENIVGILVDGVVGIVEALAPVLPAITEAFTAMTEIISNAIVAIIEILAPYIPEITKMVEATAEAIKAICDAFTALVEQIAPVIDSITGLVKQLGESLTEILGGASELVTAFGDSVSKVIESIGNAISGVIDSIGGVFDSMGEAALNAGKGFEHLANGIKTITGLNLFDMAASMTAVGISLGDLVRKSKGIGEAGSGMDKLASSLKIIANNGNIAAIAFINLSAALPRFVSSSSNANSALTTLGESLTTFGAGAKKAGNAAIVLSGGLLASVTGIISAGDSTKGLAKSASSAEKSLAKMQKSASGNGKELNALATITKTALASVQIAFKSTAKTAEESGKLMGTGFRESMKTGLVAAPSIATKGIIAVNVALLAGVAKAYQAGAFISIGFANGMRSQLSVIRSAAAQMAIAAQQALEAKAKIASPSKVTTKDGQWWGQGYANGMMDKVKEVRRAAEALVTIPQVATPRLAMAYGGELDADYSYTNSGEYIIEVPVTIDGKEVARVSAPYTQAELNRRETRDSRKRGKV